MHIQKNSAKVLENTELSEKETEWDKVIKEIVDKAHFNLDKAK